MKDSTTKEWDMSNVAFIKKHGVPLDLISLNWIAKHVTVKGQIVVKTCQDGSLKFSKYQDVEDEVEELMQKWQTKKLITTTVSSREKGIRRREEEETTSSQRKISKQGNQEESKKNHMKPEDESPTQRRNRKNDNDDEAKRMEDTRSRGGGRLKHCIVDGDVPLCLRRKLKDSNESSSSKRKTYEEKESRSSTQSTTKHCVMNNTASGSKDKDICPCSTEEKDKHSKKQGSDLYHSSKKHEVNALK